MTETDPLIQSRQILVYKSRSNIFQWVAEINLVTRRLRLFRTCFWRWTKTIVDCSLDDCVALGTVEYHNDEGPWYGTYFKLTNGNWYAIPTKGVSFKEASKIVRQVSAATEISRLDIRYS